MSGLGAFTRFVTEIEELLHEQIDSMPLQSFCSHGGVVGDTDDVELTNLHFSGMKDGNLWGRFTIQFTEVNKTGCKDVTFSDPVRAELAFSLSTKTGLFAFDDVALPSGE